MVVIDQKEHILLLRKLTIKDLDQILVLRSQRMSDLRHFDLDGFIGLLGFQSFKSFLLKLLIERL